MERNSHSKSTASLRRICQSLLLIFATTISAVCSTPQKTARQPLGMSASGTEISIIPAPVSIVPANGYFEFSRDINIIAADPSAVKVSTVLNNILMERYGFTLKVTDRTSQNSITFSTANTGQDQSGAGEGYSLKIQPGAIQIMGSERGMFYGIQSLLQLFPRDFKGEANIPAADITDAPRFRYRGMHLDVARHFMPVEFVKKFIRLISRYKYNYFHWHLTDDQGWRIEIQKYPRLTEFGSKRGETKVGKCPTYGDVTPVKAFYDQEDIREVVEYAKERYVTIVPEIDLPGHSSAALASYPNLVCKKNPPYEVQTTWPASPNVYCPKESTFQFIEDVLSEVIRLFPNSPYIHIGGDEVLKGAWGNFPEVKDFKRANKLSSEKEVQRWFIKRVEHYLSSKGKKTIAWDDMVNVGLPPNATVMYWRDSPEARRNTEVARRTVTNAVIAARARHEVIMTPDTATYFDHPPDNSRRQESMYKSPITLDEVYNFEPVPPELNQEEAKYIIGGEGCIWTECLKGPENVEYMMFPRALALAEALWSKQGNKDFIGFSKRLQKEFSNLDREPVNRWKLKTSGFGDQKNRRVTTPESKSIKTLPKPARSMPIRRKEPSPK